jgi:SRSO17 transposase
VVPGGAAYLPNCERRLAPDGERAKPRPRVTASCRGLLRPAERRHGWQLADISEEATSSALQHRLHRVLWGPEALRDEPRPSIVPHLADPVAVLGPDETGFLNRGRHSAGGAHHDRGTAGPWDHGQIGVVLGEASPRGDALMGEVGRRRSACRGPAPSAPSRTGLASFPAPCSPVITSGRAR